MRRAVCCWQVAHLKDPWVAATEDLEAFEQLVTEVRGADYRRLAVQVPAWRAALCYRLDDGSFALTSAGLLAKGTCLRDAAILTASPPWRGCCFLPSIPCYICLHPLHLQEWLLPVVLAE